MPSVMPVEENIETSYYRPKDNTIYIHKDHYGDGITYSEECGHCLRRTITDQLRIDDVLKDDQIAVEEFFGRLAENLGRSLSSEIKLEHLFQKEERNWSKTDKFQKMIKI